MNVDVWNGGFVVEVLEIGSLRIFVVTIILFKLLILFSVFLWGITNKDSFSTGSDAKAKFPDLIRSKILILSKDTRMLFDY